MTAPPRVARILVVANRTASTPELLEEVGRRRDGSRFTLVIPPEHGAEHADWTAAEASKLLERACYSDVEILDAGPDVFDTVHEAVGDGDFDAIIVNMPEKHLTRLMHHDLTRRLRRLGLPVVVIAPEPGASLSATLQSGLPGTYRDGLD